MLILTRKLGQSIMIGDDIEITVSSINLVNGKHQVKLGIKAPGSVGVHRQEIYEQIQADREDGREG